MSDNLIRTLVIVAWVGIGLFVALLLGHTKVYGLSFTMLKPWTAAAFIIFWIIAFFEEASRLNFWE